MIYVGSAEDAGRDQVLEEVMVGPVAAGVSQFVLQAPAPDPNSISNEDLIGVTVVLVTCSYRDQKFVQIGYYINNEYSEPYEEGTLPNPIDIAKLRRQILAEEPRVTRYAINWNGENGTVAIEGTEESVVNPAEDDEGMDLNEMEEDEDDDDVDDDDEGDDEKEIDLADEVDEPEDEGVEEGALGNGEGQGNEFSDVHNADTGNNPNVFLGHGQVLMQEDSNSMDVARLQSRAPLF